MKGVQTMNGQAMKVMVYKISKTGSKKLVETIFHVIQIEKRYFAEDSGRTKFVVIPAFGETRYLNFGEYELRITY